MTSIAFLGLGGMGSRMAARLLEAGHDLIVYNRTPERARALVEAGATAADSPAEAAGAAELVITMLADPAALRAVTEGDRGLAGGLTSDSTVIEMSTVGPAEIERLRQLLPEGTGLLDSPVLGSLNEAQTGTLRLFVGGPAELAERWMPLLEALGTPMYAGELGAGASAKLVANSTLFGVLGVLGEAVALGDALGLSRAVTLGVLAASPVAQQAERRAAFLERDETPERRFALALARKDVGLVLAAATEAGLDLPVAGAADSWLERAEREGRGDEDYSAVLSTIIG
jgi:3-hydroxyisobutyrate dehydrogenase-like beta-hydroxyacid dehydrogenase